MHPYFHFIHLHILITRTPYVFISLFGSVFMYYSLHPHIHFTHPYLLCAPPACDSLTPPMSLFLFLGLCLCITRCTLTFTSHTRLAYFVHLPHVIVSHLLCLCFSFWACVYVLLAAPSHSLHVPHLLTLCTSRM